MDPQVVAEEYLDLQNEIIVEQNSIKELLNQELEFVVDVEKLDMNIPVLPQLETTPIPFNLYEEAVRRIALVLQKNDQLYNDITILLVNISNEDLVQWIRESINFGTEYFLKYSQEHGIAEWLPHFVAEQALRPFMQLIADKCEFFINEFDVMGTCPCCGEPPRLALLNADVSKLLTCSRCETKWKQKRLQCVHCGEDRQENLFYLEIKEDALISIEVCKTCRNYLKLIKSAAVNEGKQAALLDLETLHIDFVAQEEGYGEER